jgi:predicted transcriptional regulator
MSRKLTVEEELLRVYGMSLRTKLTGGVSVENIAHEHRNYIDRRRRNAGSIGHEYG